MQFSAAIFDMDGTLVDSLCTWEILWTKMGKEYLGDGSFRPSEQDDRLVRTMLLRDAMALIHKNYHIGKSGEELLDFANDMFIHFYREEVCLKPGVQGFLDYLIAQNITMCVASATAKNLVSLAMEHCGLNAYFSCVISCADVGKGKEEPDVFIAACRALGSEIGDTCVFEDSLAAIKTAKKAGFKTVGIFDKNNYGQEELQKTADVYIAEGQTLQKLLA